MRLPSSHILSTDLLDTGGSPLALGGYSEIFKGTYAGLDVCVKRLKDDSTRSPERVVKGRVCRDQSFTVTNDPIDALQRSLDMEATDTP